MIKKLFKLKNEYFALCLVFLSSILLGIWAVKGTIALRNILLVLGSLISIYYIIQEFRNEKLKEELTIWKLFPIILITSTFLWVIVHYFLFSLDPISQLDELISTWLRAFLASIVGLGTGLALRNYPNRLNLLWLGIFIVFLVLYCQYIPRALAQNKLLVPDYDHYLFHLKVNTVLMGMILMAGICGALLDHLRAFRYCWRYIKLWYLFYWLLGTGLVLWAFVYIADARNGIGLSTILYSFWFVCLLTFFIRNKLHILDLKTLLVLSIAGLSLCLILYFVFLQMNMNKGWHSLLEDAKVAVQIDRYPNWQNSAQMGYPSREDGQMVNPSNYERVALAVVGSKAILAYPKGVGVLAFPLAKHPQVLSKMLQSSASIRIATHSGWVELGLAFGIPILGLIFSALLLTFIIAARHDYPARMTVLGLVVMISILYTTGELTIYHGLEILFYLLALVSALLLTKPSDVKASVELV